MIVDLLQAAQDALFSALKPVEGDSGMPTGLAVYQHVPEGTEPPMVVIGQVTTESDDEKGDQYELITAEIQYVYRGPGRAPLLAMMHAGRTRLDKQALSAPGAAFEPPRFTRGEASEALGDGITYVGLQYFEFHAEPG